MKNITSNPAQAAAMAKRLRESLQKRPDSDYGDWIIAFTRKGFTKAEARREFLKTGLKLEEDGRIAFSKFRAPATRSSQQSLELMNRQLSLQLEHLKDQLYEASRYRHELDSQLNDETKTSVAKFVNKPRRKGFAERLRKRSS